MALCSPLNLNRQRLLRNNRGEINEISFGGLAVGLYVITVTITY